MALGQILVLAAAIAVGQFTNSMVLPVLPLLAQDLGVSAGEAGMVVTVYFAGFAVVGLLVGPLSDRLGRRRLLVGGILLLTCGSLAGALATSFVALLMFRLVEAAGAAGTPVLARAIVRDKCDGDALAAALGLLATIMSISPVVGPLLGGLLAEIMGWRGLFGVLAAMAALAVLAVFIAIPETLKPSGVDHDPGAVWRQMRGLLAQRAFCAGALYGAAFFFSFGAIYAFAPFVLIERFGLSHGAFGAAFAVMSATMAIGGILGPRLTHLPLPVRLLDLAAGLAVLAGLLLIGVAALGQENVVSIILCLALFGLSFGVALSVGAAFTLGEAGSAAGTASSVTGFLQAGTAAIGSAAVNLLHSGSTVPMSLILLATGGVALMAIRHIDVEAVHRPARAAVTRR
jgi:DHA1 family bicyclomycin/chloramphenicol resistance-like MFS transporter